MLLWMKPVCRMKFQSTLPARGATERLSMLFLRSKFQSTLPARGATRPALYTAVIKAFISIHAPRTGSDLPLSANTVPAYNFNPRSPHGERQNAAKTSVRKVKFQSTLPARGATNYYADLLSTSVISIHAPRTGSDQISALTGIVQKDFNPRSPHGERHKLARRENAHWVFQSTLPARGATYCNGYG